MRTELQEGLAPESDWRPGRTVGVILAGGTGTRLGLDIPKQLLKIAGKTIIEHTAIAFETAVEIDEVIILMAPGYVDQVREIVTRGGLSKVKAVAEGGSSRSETTRRALDMLGDEPCNVVFHDAVRPLVSGRIIRECVNALHTYSAVDVAIPSADTIIMVDDDDHITGIPDRAILRRGQTPQAFRSSTIREAYRRAAHDPSFAATDDCGVVQLYMPEVPIKVIGGAEENIKVTHPIDVHVADKLYQLTAAQAPHPMPDRHYREHFAGRTVVVFGASYGIGEKVAKLAESYGAIVFSFSRSGTNTHVERPDDVAAALKRASDATGRIDYVVVTAGVLHNGLLADADEGTIEQAVQVNYLAPITVARLAAPHLQETQGQLLLYTSSSYTRGRAGYALYSSTKAAVVNLTQALADEWSELKIRVNCINPERTATPMRTRAFGAEPPDTLLSSETVARVSLSVLSSDLSGHVVDVRRTTAGMADQARS